MWEYKEVEFLPHQYYSFMRILSELGEERWELCSILQRYNGNERTAYFKRFIPIKKNDD